MERIYILSFASVRRIFPNNTTEAEAEVLKLTIQIYFTFLFSERSEHVDTQAVLKDPKWLKYFQAMQPFDQDKLERKKI